MAITAAGVGSGLDIENIVSQLMSLERRPLVAIQTQVSVTQANISSYGTLKSAVSSFQDAMQELSTLAARLDHLNKELMNVVKWFEL